MTDTIIQQQLQLHFGEEFNTVYAKTRSYVKGLIGKSWWVDRRALLSSEGPLSRMVEDCLSHVIDKGDTILGYRAYTSYLSSLYGSNVAAAKAVGNGYCPFPEGQAVAWSTMGDYNVSLDSLSETLVESDVSDELTIFDEEQADFIAVYSTMGVAAAADEFDISDEQARTRRNTIKRTVARRLGS